MSFGLYALGFLIVVGGLIYGAHLMHVPAHWIAVGLSCFSESALSRGCKPPGRKILPDPVFFVLAAA